MEGKCAHVPTRGASTGVQCRNNGLHDGYCHKHKRTVVPEAVRATTTGGATAVKTEKKSYFSNFMWTINSNTSGAKITQDQIRQFQGIISFVMQPECIKDFLRNRKPNGGILNLKTDYVFEISPKTHSYHAHGYIRLEHDGNFILQIESLRAFLSKVWGKKVHLNVSASGDEAASWQQYMAKMGITAPIVPPNH